jgi:hypothetical protein
MLQSLREAADQIVAGTLSANDAVQKIQTESPKLASLLKRAVQIGIGAVMFISAVAGIAGAYYTKKSYDAAQEQIRIGNEQIEIAKAANTSPDVVLERTLEALRNLWFTSHGTKDNPIKKGSASPSAGPANSKTHTKTETSHLSKKQKPKMR